MIIEVLLIALSVSMDSFAVSIGKGLAARRVHPLDAVKTGLWFGAFEALFPLIGYYAASALAAYITSTDHWIIFILLALIGCNMIREAFPRDGEEHANAEFGWRTMLPLAIACSIDAFAVGVSLAFMKVNILFAVAAIVVITGITSAIGIYAGHLLGSRWQKPAQIAGGTVLILVGLKIFLEHMNIISW